MGLYTMEMMNMDEGFELPVRNKEGTCVPRC